jgi:hypothetical protein
VPTVVLSGHLHLRGVVTDGAVLQIAFAALIEAPYDVAVVEISEGLAVSYQCASVQPIGVERVPVLAPPTARFAWDASQATWQTQP